MDLNQIELEDLNYLMEKIVNGESFHVIEISRAEYLLKKIKGGL